MKSKYGKINMLINFIACERTDIVPWYLRFGVSIIIIGCVCLGVGLFLSVFGAKFFKFIVVILIVFGGGFFVRSIIGQYLKLNNLGNLLVFLFNK